MNSGAGDRHLSMLETCPLSMSETFQRQGKTLATQAGGAHGVLQVELVNGQVGVLQIHLEKEVYRCIQYAMRALYDRNPYDRSDSVIVDQSCGPIGAPLGVGGHPILALLCSAVLASCV